jgi:radical SAM protein with 4Fe4S-binding SPASM domain
MNVEVLNPNQKAVPQEPLVKRRNSYFEEQARLFIRSVIKRKVTLRKLFNVFLCDLAYALKITKGAPAPYILNLELWNECNAGCLFCRDKKGKIHDINKKGTGMIAKGKMPLETAKGIIDQLKDDVLIAVLYTNGEPLLYKELPQLIQHATNQRVSTMIASNGLLFTEENARAILEAGIDFIKIQISGFTQDIYSVQIRYGEVEHLKENIKMLAKMNKEGNYGTVILIDYILYNYNKHQMPLVKQMCKELGLMMSMRPGNPFGGLENLEPPLLKENLPLKVSCDYLWKVMQVNFNGDILPCCEAVVWSEAKPYDTFQSGKTDVKKVWQGEAAQTMRTTMATKGRGAMDICAQCTRRGVCFKW